MISEIAIYGLLFSAQPIIYEGSAEMMMPFSFLKRHPIGDIRRFYVSDNQQPDNVCRT